MGKTGRVEKAIAVLEYEIKVRQFAVDQLKAQLAVKKPPARKPVGTEQGRPYPSKAHMVEASQPITVEKAG